MQRAPPVRFAVELLVAIPLLAGLPAGAQDIEPRAYSNAPFGVNFLIGGLAFTREGLASDSSSPIADLKSNTVNAVVGCARVLDFWGMSGKFDMIGSQTWMSGTERFAGTTFERDVSTTAPGSRTSAPTAGRSSPRSAFPGPWISGRLSWRARQPSTPTTTICSAATRDRRIRSIRSRRT